MPALASRSRALLNGRDDRLGERDLLIDLILSPRIAPHKLDNHFLQIFLAGQRLLKMRRRRSVFHASYEPG
jgi:hypothetical protein